jgi:CelD/BcsL family acetyltransferase involved in cellulose biosynthesis
LIADLKITEESFESLALLRSRPGLNIDWNLVFTLPSWLKVMWQNFSSGATLYLKTLRQNDHILGIAPLQICDVTASIIGSVNVCDYQDFITLPGREREFYRALIGDLLKHNITRLHLETIRADSTIRTHLLPLAQELNFKIDYHQSDVSSDMPLPADWNDYLAILDSKQRHELKRKMRNLNAAILTSFHTIADKETLLTATENFLKLFPESRGDKAIFMTAEMQTYFRSLAAALSEEGILRYGSLDLNGKPIAMVMYFDYQDNYYLYNSAYDPAYRSLSVGIISKALCIKDAIEKGKKRFDFLKGPEVYKSHLGGQEFPLYSCEITLAN